MKRDTVAAMIAVLGGLLIFIGSVDWAQIDFGPLFPKGGSAVVGYDEPSDSDLKDAVERLTEELKDNPEKAAMLAVFYRDFRNHVGAESGITTTGHLRDVHRLALMNAAATYSVLSAQTKPAVGELIDEIVFEHLGTKDPIPMDDARKKVQEAYGAIAWAASKAA